MAGGQERVLKRRIKTMTSTKKITRAMELIAATRIVKAQQRVLAARPYADQITAVIRSLAAGGAGVGQPLLTPKTEVNKIGYLVIAGDRGLAGAYNSGVIRLAERALQARVVNRSGAAGGGLVEVRGRRQRQHRLQVERLGRLLVAPDHVEHRAVVRPVGDAGPGDQRGRAARQNGEGSGGGGGGTEDAHAGNLGADGVGEKAARVNRPARSAARPSTTGRPR